MRCDEIEQEIQDKGLVGPRVTLSDIEENIGSEHYFTAGEALNKRFAEESSELGPLGLLTFCVLVLKNGFTIVGTSACLSPENYDAELGRRIARRNAVEQMWPLMGYALKKQLFEGQTK